MSKPLFNHNELFSFKPAIWLIFSLYYFIPMFYVSFDFIQVALLSGAYFAFLAIYLWGSTLCKSQVWIPVTLILALAIYTSCYTTGANVFFVYLGSLIGFNYTVRTYYLLIGFVLAIIAALHLKFQYPIPYFLLPAASGFLIVSIFEQFERMRSDTRVQWIQSRQEVEQLAVIAERERIARDLHDLLGHTLSTIALKAELSEKLLKQQKYSQAEEHVADLHKVARESLSLVRQTVSGYKHRGLSGEVMELCSRLRQNGFVVELLGEIPQLNPRAETTVILALTELTTNVLRHSRGDHCRIQFLQDNDYVIIKLFDNGRLTREITPGNGLDGVSKRLQGLYGELQVDITQGCEFTIHLPLSELKEH